MLLHQTQKTISDRFSALGIIKLIEERAFFSNIATQLKVFPL